MPFIFCCNFVLSTGYHSSNSCFWLLAALCPLPSADVSTRHSNAGAIFAEPCKKSDCFSAKKLFDQTLNKITLFTPHSFCNSHWLFHYSKGTSGENLWRIFQGIVQAHTDSSSKAEEASELGTHHPLPNSLHSEPDFSPSARARVPPPSTAVVALGAPAEQWKGEENVNSRFRIPTGKFSCGAVTKLKRKGTTGHAAQAAQCENVELKAFIPLYNAALHSHVDVRTLRDLLWSAGVGDKLGNFHIQQWRDFLKSRVPFLAILNLY